MKNVSSSCCVEGIINAAAIETEYLPCRFGMYEMVACFALLQIKSQQINFILKSVSFRTSTPQLNEIARCTPCTYSIISWPSER